MGFKINRERQFATDLPDRRDFLQKGISLLASGLVLAPATEASEAPSNHLTHASRSAVALLNWAAGGKIDPTVVSNAPSPVEIVTMEQIGGKRTVVHALNWQPSWPGVRAHEVEVAIKGFGRRPKRAFAIEAQAEIPLRTDHDRVRLAFPPIDAWETVVLEWA